jgi:predicted Zn-dependent protease
MAILGAVACERSPYTGRVQSMAFDEDEAIVRADAAATQYRNRVRLVTDPVIVARVQRITTRLVDAAKRGPAGVRAARLAWSVTAVDDTGTQVAILENGAIFPGGALVRLAANDDELAFPLARAMAHVLLRHPSERVGRHLLPFSAAASLGVFPESGPGSLSDLDRSQRDEADQVGLRLMIAAGFDPERGLAILDRLGDGARATRLREELPTLRATTARDDRQLP